MISYLKNPEIQSWEKIFCRPKLEEKKLSQIVEKIWDEVRLKNDNALRELTKKLDGCEIQDFKVSESRIEQSKNNIDIELRKSILVAYDNISRFHNSQIKPHAKIEISPGVKCWRESRPINNVGLYIPGGSAPLFSTLLMLGIPAKIAGVKNINIVTPPNRDGEIDDVILYVASILKISNVFKIGGAQSIAALSMGTNTIPKVDKIFGPGNQYVTKSKFFASNNGTDIDMLSGPSEVFIIADKTCNPKYVAADLLSQAEHGPDSQFILATDDKSVIANVQKEIEEQLLSLPRAETIMKSIKNSFLVNFENINDCVKLSNFYAPEHLIIASKNFENHIYKIINAGSVFLGNYSCESAGDYASGTNHVLPTGGLSLTRSGVSVDSFLKTITFQKLTSNGLRSIGPAIINMADAEGMHAHSNSVKIRLDK